MNAGEQRGGARQVSRPEGRAELERLLADPRFQGTERARSILVYLAERYLGCCDKAVKAYAIALDVLGRSVNFDSAIDPIVRIEMSRLRSCLSHYYEAFGKPGGVCIHVPRGHYVTIFSRSLTADDMALDDEDGEAAEKPAAALPAAAGLSRGYRLQIPYVVGLIMLSIGVTGSATSAWYGNRPVVTGRPAVALAMASTDDGHAAEADITEDYLVAAMSRFRTLDIASQAAMPTGSTTSGARPTAGSSYDIDMKYYADGDERSVWWRVIDNRGGGILKSGVDKVAVAGRDEAAVRDELVSILAKRFASTRGVINALETRDGAATSLLGNSCVLKAEYELDEGGQGGIRSALPCLERTVAIQPGNADALAVLSRTLVAAEGGNPATTPFERALTMANRAASLDPTSDRAQVALMMVQFYMGRSEAAIAAGNAAVAINPVNPDVLSKLAAVLYSSGYPDAAISLAAESAKDVDAVPRDARIVLALDAYSRGDYSNASLVSEQINCSDVVVRAIRAAALGQMGAADARPSLDYLKAMLPDYQTGLRQRMQWRRYPEAVIAALEQGLSKAGQVTIAPRRARS